MRVPVVMEEEGQAEDAPDLIVGRCAAMQEVYKAIGRVAPQDLMVLILGETGTGKEVVARAIYQYSRRAAGPFMAINCAAIPESCWRANCSATSEGPSRAPIAGGSVGSSSVKAGRYSWTRSVTWRR